MRQRRLGRLDFGGFVFGGILLFVGLYYMLRNTLGFDIGELDWDPIWPILVILLGVSVVIGAYTRRHGDDSPQ